jgi:hypothetical protein
MAATISTRLRDEAGFSIIEVMIAAVVLIVGVLGTLTMIDVAQGTTRGTKAREQATSLQRELIEAVRTVPYDQLVPGNTSAVVRNQPGLGDSSLSSPGWTIRRRDVTYNVSMGSCAVDDPRDATGAHEAGVFCANQGTPTTPAQCASIISGGSGAGVASPGDCGVDANKDGDADNLVSTSATTCSGASCDTAPLDYKRVVSLVTWTQGSQTKWLLEVTTVNSPGIAAAPAVTSLTPTNLPSNGTTATGGTSVVFIATASPKPTTMAWYLDGTYQGAAAPSGSNWGFTWDLGSASTSDGAQPSATEVLDGDYLVSAKGFDQYGQYGQTRAVTITVNRRKPFAPIRVRAGRNGTAVDIEWAPNKEGDIKGYRVYRKPSSGSTVLVCTTADNTCRDTSAPAPNGTPVQYYVTAYETDAAGGREGDQSGTATVNDLDTPPNGPISLNATTSGASVVLSWTPAPVGDVDPGDSIDHYVIYRDGISYADRYDRTATGKDTSWTDTRTNGQQHTYSVTAVDTQLGESKPTLLVTR